MELELAEVEAHSQWVLLMKLLPPQEEYTLPVAKPSFQPLL